MGGAPGYNKSFEGLIKPLQGFNGLIHEKAGSVRFGSVRFGSMADGSVRTVRLLLAAELFGSGGVGAGLLRPYKGLKYYLGGPF